MTFTPLIRSFNLVIMIALKCMHTVNGRTHCRRYSAILASRFAEIHCSIAYGNIRPYTRDFSFFQRQSCTFGKSMKNPKDFKRLAPLLVSI